MLAATSPAALRCRSGLTGCAGTSRFFEAPSSFRSSTSLVHSSRPFSNPTRLHDENTSTTNGGRELHTFCGRLALSYRAAHLWHWLHDQFVRRAFRIGAGNHESELFCWKHLLTGEILRLQQIRASISLPRPGFALEATPVKRIFAPLATRGNVFASTRLERRDSAECQYHNVNQTQPLLGQHVRSRRRLHLALLCPRPSLQEKSLRPICTPFSPGSQIIQSTALTNYSHGE